MPKAMELLGPTAEPCLHGHVVCLSESQGRPGCGEAMAWWRPSKGQGVLGPALLLGDRFLSLPAGHLRPGTVQHLVSGDG